MNSIQHFDYTPILGWSMSRYDTFTSCKRMYYYNYYSKYDPDFSTDHIMKLKKLTSIPLEIGKTVHDVIAVLLNRLQKTESTIDQDRFFDYTKRKIYSALESENFHEVYYKEVVEIEASQIIDKTETSLNNFMNSNRFKWLLENAVGNKKGWVIEPPGYGETRIDGLKAYCKVDFLFPLGDEFFILDWKTGKASEEKHSKQLVGYSAWASYHFNKDPARINPIIAYLHPDYYEIEVSVNEFDIQEFSIQVQKETEEMYKYCNDIEENIPKNKNIFEMIGNINFCGYCNFKELCNR